MLDIGSGWGGLALSAWRGTTARWSPASRCRPSDWPSRAPGRRPRGYRIACRSSCSTTGSWIAAFDRIVSVGMFEHVGVVHYRAFFDTVARCLEPDGVALLHAIGRSDRPGFTNPSVRSPSSYCPALSEVVAPVEKSGLIATDIEILRLHYAETLRHWRHRSRRQAATRSPRCMTNASAACSSSICAAPRSPSISEGHMVFQVHPGTRPQSECGALSYVGVRNRLLIGQKSTYSARDTVQDPHLSPREWFPSNSGRAMLRRQ